ncbi:serine/threonine dehydratase [Luteitalea sp. TBR-22]|uniref:threonine ammonia-lyase n=1 Tax=Luteitalea sp. TBR-22 TaxID=2802971 RepID=UPI001AF7ECCB|nr:threonine/serine dehydratase [Luteitalea sp. TBR-22]BCS35792.1 serine/threonine dehydratase [Luteitalea sp. TBR-22]
MSVSFEHVQAAARRIAPFVRRTPLLRAEGLSAVTGREVWLKLETLQRTRAFKRRGAVNALLALEEREGAVPPLVTASAGNHGVALSSIARERGARLTIYVPKDAPRAKLDRLRGEGITIVADCADYDEAEARALAASHAGHGRFISAYAHPDVIAGAGTIALEVLEDLPSTGAIVVPTGGGGLLSGVAIGADFRVPAIGVEPEVNPAFTSALAAGHTTTITPGTSLADGLLGNLEPGALTFDLVKDLDVPVRLVPETFLVDGVRALFVHERLVAEGAGGIAVGALLAGALDAWPDPLVLLVTGANIDAPTFARVVGQG